MLISDMDLLGPAIACGILVAALAATAIARAPIIRNFGWGAASGSGIWVLVGVTKVVGESLAIFGGSMRPVLTGLPFVAAFIGLAASAGIVVVVVGLVWLSWKRAGAPTWHVATILGAAVGISARWIRVPAQVANTTIPVVLIIRGSSERPIEGAQITWAIQRNAGWRSDVGDVWQQRVRGPSGSSDADGRGSVSMHRGPYRTEVHVEKRGFVPATLRLECAEGGLISRAGVSFPGYANGKGGALSSTGPLAVYLPTDEEFNSRQVVQVRFLAWRIGLGRENARTVTLWTTRSGVPVQVRIWPELEPVGPNSNARVVQTHVEPLSGTRLALCPAYPRHFDGRATSADWLSVAPAHGASEVLKLRAGSMPSDTFYVLAPRDEEYGRLLIEYCRPEIVNGRNGSDYIVEASVAHNPTGARGLFPPTTEYRKPPIE